MNRILCKQRICRVSNGNVCMDEDKRHWGTVCYNFFTLDLKQHLIKIHSKSVLTTVVVVFWIHWTSYSKQQLQQLQIQRICNNFFFPAKNTYFKRKNLDSFQKMYVRQLSSCQTIQYFNADWFIWNQIWSEWT